MRKWLSSPVFLNASIGILSVILFVLVAALISRVVYPRVLPERTDYETHLISNVIQIEVLNGYGEAGIATRYTNKLRNLGFDVVHSGNFESYDLEHTVVIARSNNKENARRVAQALGIDPRNILTETSPYYYLDATVVLGADHHLLKL